MLNRIAKRMFALAMSGMLVISAIMLTETQVYATQLEEVTEEITEESTEEVTEETTEEVTEESTEENSGEEDSEEGTEEEEKPLEKLRKWWEKCRRRFPHFFRFPEFFEHKEPVNEKTEFEPTTEESTEESADGENEDSTEETVEESTEEKLESEEVLDGTAEDDCMVDIDENRPEIPENDKPVNDGQEMEEKLQKEDKPADNRKLQEGGKTPGNAGGVNEKGKRR